MVDLRETAGAAEERPTTAASYAVLFVCMGNICRSPTAEGAFREYLRRQGSELSVEIDSAGTHAYHVGEAPDRRAREAAARRGIDLSSLRARRVTVQDFARFDMILAMDDLNRAVLSELCPAELRDRIRLLLEFAPEAGRTDVPDPYYGGPNGFEFVLDLVEEASAGLLAHVRRALDVR